MTLLPIYELAVYEDDDTTLLFDVSTDPNHARPYLKAPTSFPEQEVDFAKGSASIGQMNVHVVDVPTVLGDQDTGYLTGQLPDASGFSALNGHRALMTEDLGGGAATILDGVVKSARLLDNFSAYQLELRDIRERERKTKAFTNTTTPSVLPRGVMDGYGFQTGIPWLGGLTFYYPIPPTQPLVARYDSLSSTRGEFRFEAPQAYYLSRQILTDPMRDAFESIAPLAAQQEVQIHNRFKVLWRDNAGGGAYTELEQLAFLHPDLPDGGGQPVYMVKDDEVGIFGLRVNNEVTADTLPSDLQVCDVIVQYDGPPTEEWRHHIQDVNAGELLRNLYRGDHSEEDPRIRYDEAALLALATRVRGRLKEPIEDLREWAEKNVYPIVHAAPTLNESGEISPVTYLLPDEDETLTDLNDTNCRPTGGGWSHGSEDAVNLVKVTYKREYRFAPEDSIAPSSPRGIELSDLILERDVEIEFRTQDSIDLLGEQPLKVDSVLLTTLGGAEGGPLSGDTTLETGYNVARRIQRMATDRFALGGQYFSLLSDRSVAAVEALKTGSFLTVSVSWMPDYSTGERNLNRLAQVVSRRNRDASWTDLKLVDAGSANAPLAKPTLGTVTADAAGVVSVPIATVPAGAECRIDYAVSVLEPTAASELWEFLDRAGVSTLTTPPNPQGATVWVRARSEEEGRRPSAYITAVSVTLAGTPRLVDAFVELDDAGLPRVYWVGNEACLGVRIHYERHLVADEPTYADSVDVDVDDMNRFMTEPPPTTFGYIFSVQLEPFTGWTGAAVSGTAGPRYEVRSVGVRQLVAPRIDADFLRVSSTNSTLDLVIEDPTLTITDVEFNKREGSEAADTFTGWLSTWDRSTGTIATDTSLTRGEDLLTEEGQESIIRYRVTFTDEEGNAVILSGAFTSANQDEHSITRFYPYTLFQPVTDSANMSWLSYLARNTGTGLTQGLAGIALPSGVTITAWGGRMYREAGGDANTLALVELDQDAASTSLGTILTHSTTGWATLTRSGLTTVVDDDKIYRFGSALTPSVLPGDARLLFVFITFTRHHKKEVM